jgi:myosin heavy subunit
MDDLRTWKTLYAYCYFQGWCVKDDAFIQENGNIDKTKQIAFMKKINATLKEKSKHVQHVQHVQQEKKGLIRRAYQWIKQKAKQAGQILWNYGPAILAGIVLLWQQYTIYTQHQQLAQVKDMYEKAQVTIKRLEDHNQALAVVNDALKEQALALSKIDGFSVTNSNGEVKDVSELQQIRQQLNEYGDTLTDPIVQQKCRLAIKYVEILIQMHETVENQQDKIKELEDDRKIKEEMIKSLQKENESLQKSLALETEKNTGLQVSLNENGQRLTEAENQLKMAQEAFDHDLALNKANNEEILKQLDEAKKMQKYLVDTKASLEHDMEGKVKQLLESTQEKEKYFQKLKEANEKLNEKERQLKETGSTNKDIKLQLAAAQLAYSTQKMASDAMIAQHDAAIQVMMTKTAKQIEEMNKGHQDALTQMAVQLGDTHEILKSLEKLQPNQAPKPIEESVYKLDQLDRVKAMRHTMEKTLHTYTLQITALDTMIVQLKAGSTKAITEYNTRLKGVGDNLAIVSANLRVPFSAAISSLVTYLTQQVILDESKMKRAEAEFKFYELMMNCAETYRKNGPAQNDYDRVNFIRSMGEFRTCTLTYKATNSVLTHCRAISNRLGTDCIPDCWKFVLESVAQTWEGTSYMYFWKDGALDDSDKRISKAAAIRALNGLQPETPAYSCSSWGIRTSWDNAKKYWD